MNKAGEQAPGHLEEELARRGIRLTRQRRAIVATIESADHHLDAAQILRWAKRIEESVDRVTVYRTISLLKRHGLIDELDLMHVGGEAHYYEKRRGHDHVHVTCLQCGRVIEFESELVEKLQKQIEKQCAFHSDVMRIEVGGRCSVCLSASDATHAVKRRRKTKSSPEDEPSA